MELIQMARSMGKAIQLSGEYKRLEAAKAANDADEELQNLIGEFNMVRAKLTAAMQKEQQDTAETDRLNLELREAYTKAMGNANMMEFNVAKQEMDDLMNQVNGILLMSVNGEDPETCDPTAHSCGGDCSGCSGCH